MKLVEFKDVKPYQAPKHYNMVALKLQEMDGKGDPKLWVGLSHFLPGGGAEYDEAPVERVYFVLDGEITVFSKNGKIKLKKWDSLKISPGEGREIINKSNNPASMLVIINYPEA